MKMKFAAAALFGSLLMTSHSFGAGDTNDTAWESFAPAIAECKELVAVIQSSKDQGIHLSNEEIVKRESHRESLCTCVNYGIFNDTLESTGEEFIEDLVLTYRLFTNDEKYPGYMDDSAIIEVYMRKMHYGYTAAEMIFDGIAQCSVSLEEMK